MNPQFNVMPPSNTSIFVISDIHGCANELKLLLNKLPLTPESHLVFLGDYIDRGPQSKEVVETVLETRSLCRVTTLMGNHEHMLLAYLDNPKSQAGGMFIYNGGGATLASYQVPETDDIVIPGHHLDFFKALPLIHEEDDYFFVHAGLPDKRIDDVDPRRDMMTLLWTREAFHNSSFTWGKTVVHGHSPSVDVEFMPHRINVDTGCFYGNKLSALQLPEQSVYSVARKTKSKHVLLKERNSRRAAVRFEGALPVYVESDDALMQFETINFNELGLLIYDIIDPTHQTLQPDQVLSGEIGRDTHETVRFEGKIVRIDKCLNGPFIYAIQFTKTPYETQRKARVGDTSIPWP